jgi:hypothetical protein
MPRTEAPTDQRLATPTNRRTSEAEQINLLPPELT